MKYTIITSVGTSMLTNYKGSLRESVKGIAQETLDKPAVVTKKALDFQESDFRKTFQVKDGFVGGYVSSHWFKGIKKVEGKFDEGDPNTLNLHASAEITSLVKIIEGIRKRDSESDITIQPIATDTALSVLCALLVKAWFEQPEAKAAYPATILFEKSTDFISDLRVDLPTGWETKSEAEQRRYYDLGLQNLVDKFVGEKGYLKIFKDSNIIINFSGGYKSVIPMLTIIAQLESIPMQYIFEDSDYLIEVGGLPMGWDWEVAETVAFALNEGVLKQLEHEPPATEKILNFLSAGKLINPDRTLTSLGKYLKNIMEQDGSTVSKSILGLFVEYKLFETFLLFDFNSIRYKPEKLTIYKNSDSSLTDIASEDNQGAAYSEIDLLLSTSDGKKILVESKSYTKIKQNLKNNLEDKIRKYHEFRPHEQIAECWIIVSSPSLFENLGNWYENNNDSKIKILKQIKQSLSIAFHAFSYQFDLTKGKFEKGEITINTKRLLQRPIHPNQIMPIDLSAMNSDPL